MIGPQTVSLGSVSQTPLVLAVGQTTTPVVQTNSSSLVGILFDANFSGTSITFKACATVGGTFVPMYSTAGTALTYTVGTSRYVTINPADFYGVQFFEIVSGTTQATLPSTLTCAMKGI